ncbi:MAG: BTAD domain-containing putative transcriptional regulator [Anaerolineales bacterium]
MSEISIQLFGKFTIQADGKRLGGGDSSKVQELLAYLLVYRDRPHPREGLAELLWEASSTAQSKKYLRQALWQMQQLLPKVEAEPLIRIEPDWIRISPQASYWLDVAEFEDAFAQAHGIPGERLSERVAASLEQAAALYRGDLLEGWYSDWCLYERERLQNMWLAMLDKLMSYCEAKRDFEAGLSFGMRVLRNDRARERTHRRLMRMAYLAGDRTGALRQYERCVQALEEELSVRPSRRTEELHHEIEADTFESTDAMGMVDSQISTVTNRLDQLRGILTQLREHVSEDLDALDHALTDPD